MYKLFQVRLEETCTLLLGCILGTGALNEAWALFQKLLSMNGSNLLAAAFNYNIQAVSWEKRRKTDRQGFIV